MHTVWRSRMYLKRPLQLGAASAVCALALFAADFWKTKDSTLWNSEEINKLLSDSPWARAKTVQPQQSTPQRGMGRRGGGFGFPGGGGYPGGGYPGGGGGYPNGGGGYPGGSNGGGSNGDGSQSGPMNLTIRWDSAAPVQQALMRQGAGQADELKAATTATEKYYVVEVLGLRLPQGRSRSSSYPDDQNSDSTSNNNDDNNQRSRNQNNNALRSQLLDAAQLAPKGKSSIYAQDVQIDGPDGIDGVRFLFPRNNPITGNDKEVDFILDIRRIKVEEKFKLSDMQYEGKLAI
jgi:hypothetical protein